ncbi:MAG: small ribosomal subunit biogenesis GTPase RsgA [Pseudomonadota bacterium]
MSRRRLSTRQRRHVDKLQADRLARAQDKQSMLSEDELGPLGEEQEGLVVSRYGKTVDVEGSDGQVYRCQIRQHLHDLVCGDRVIWQAAPDGTGVVVAQVPRKSVLCRPDFQQRMKTIAANIDQILIVCATQPELSTGLIDRYLVAAEATKITPMIIVNKTDLLTPTQRAEVEAQLALYQNIGYRLIYTSVVARHGLDELIAQLKDHTSIFVGHSGVGKSSLVKALLPHQEIRIGELSEATGKGTHTTTTAVLYHLDHGGDLIDSPGIREFGLWGISAEQVAEGFVEFRPFLPQCKFRNCQHRQEPGCALRAAVESGEITRQRLDSYYRIVESLTES